MKHLLLTSSLFLATASYGEILFSLQDQYYSESMPKIEKNPNNQDKNKNKDGPMKPGRYDVGKAIVSMNLSRWSSGVYSTLPREEQLGYFNVELKTPAKNWAVSWTAKYGFNYNNYCKGWGTQPVKLIASNGEVLSIDVKICSVDIQNNEIKTHQNNEFVDFFVKIQGDKVVFHRGGLELLSVAKGNFNDLKKVEMSISKIRDYTVLKNITIGEQK